MNNNPFKISMILPIIKGFKKEFPIVPSNYYQWLFNATEPSNILIRFINFDNLKFEEFDSAFYIHLKNQYGGYDEFLRYDIDNQTVLVRSLPGHSECKEIITVQDFINACELFKIKILIETPGNCTYGIK